jgi:mono/diheme cytochrome c family protein
MVRRSVIVQIPGSRHKMSTRHLQIPSPLLWFIVVWFALAASLRAQTRTAGLEPGLKVKFSSAGQSDVTARPNAALYVPRGKSPTASLSAGPFTAEFEGFVSIDLRSEYSFHADFRGEFKIELNGTPVLDTNSLGTAMVASRPVRLNKGTNSLRAIFRSPADGDAFLRLHWAAKGSLPGPVPSAALTHAPDSELKRADQTRLGNELFIEHRCLKCHAPSSPTPSPDVSFDAPALEGIGSRRAEEWMAEWIFDPKAQRPVASMPQLFRGPSAKNDAEAAAAYLASLKAETREEEKQLPKEGEQAGRQLFEKLHCAACHIPPDTSEPDQGRISLKQVGRKFLPGMLATFLQKPDAHYLWIRMPNFRLSGGEAGRIASYLESNSDQHQNRDRRPDPAQIERGKQLVQTSGCLNCHSLKLENRFLTKALSDLGSAKWQQGCLAEFPEQSSKAPQFHFSTGERAALRTLGLSDRSSMAKLTPTEFVEWQIRKLNCRECHGKFEGFPPLDLLGGKLRPEWTRSFVAGDVNYKPRPWIEARMPSFKPYAQGIAEGMAMLHGYPPQTPVEPAVDEGEAATGRKLVSAAGGFSCIACHAVGELAATQGFESAGINLAHTGERLLKSYFQRWIRNPLAIDPATKMPVYFDEQGRSPLTDIYDGDGLKQIDALWEYVRLGDKMPPPPMP